MSIIRLLIVKTWFKYLIGAIVVLLLLLTAGNLIAGFLRSNVTPTDVLKNYIIELPNLLGKVIPVSCIFASLFSINHLRNTNELVAIFATGFSYKKYVQLLILCSSIVSITLFFSLGILYPYFKSARHDLLKDKVSRFRNQKSIGLRSNTLNSGKMWYKGKNYFFSLVSFNKSTQIVNDLKIYYFNNFNSVNKIIHSKTARFKQNQMWELSDVYLIDNSEKINFPVIKQLPKLDVFLQESPSDIMEIESDITTLNFLDLYEYISRLNKSTINTDEYKVILYDKIGLSLICIVFTLLGALTLYNPNRRNASIGKSIFYIFTLITCYWLGHSYLTELGKNSKIQPLTSVFTIHILLSLIIISTFYRHRKLR